MVEPPEPSALQIRTHLEPLVARATERLRSQVPWYQTLAPLALREMVRQDYQALSNALATNDTQGFRRYAEQSGEARLRAGAPAASLIAAISVLEDELHSLLALGGADPVGRGDATRRLQSLTRNMRMIVSGVNLRLLTGATHQPARSDPPSTTL